jgi:Icc-related predicted phosphoesterase
MRVAAVGDIHGHENLDPFAGDLERLEPPDLFLLAGDLTDRNDAGAFKEVVAAIRRRVSCPIYGVFGNNEYANSQGAYRDSCDFAFLDDEVVTVRVAGREIRLVGSTGSLDRPTWWQRNNLPGIAKAYDERVGKIDKLLEGDGVRVLLTHYPPTHATMGGEKEAWRPELGSTKLEAVVLRRRPDVVIHGHIHKGIPRATLAAGQRTIEDLVGRASIPVYNVAYPVTHGITLIEM